MSLNQVSFDRNYAGMVSMVIIQSMNRILQGIGIESFKFQIRNKRIEYKTNQVCIWIGNDPLMEQLVGKCMYFVDILGSL